MIPTFFLHIEVPLGTATVILHWNFNAKESAIFMIFHDIFWAQSRYLLFILCNICGSHRHSNQFIMVFLAGIVIHANIAFRTGILLRDVHNKLATSIHSNFASLQSLSEFSPLHDPFKLVFFWFQYLSMVFSYVVILLQFQYFINSRKLHRQ